MACEKDLLLKINNDEVINLFASRLLIIPTMKKLLCVLNSVKSGKNFEFIGNTCIGLLNSAL